jgi:hypothetical protein
MKKVDKARLFEFASGMKLEDFLYDRVSRDRTADQILGEMNDIISKCNFKKAFKIGIFKITENNLWRWFGLIGIKKKGDK